MNRRSEPTPQGSDYDQIPSYERPWLPRSLWPNWFVTKRVLKVLWQAVAVIAAIPVVVAAVVFLRDTITLYPAYQEVEVLAAGTSVARFDDVLGVPSSVKQATWDRDGVAVPVQIRDYTASEYVVRAIADDEQIVIVMSILTCREDFDPTFVTPSQSTIQLGNRPIAVAETSRDGTLLDVSEPTRIWAATSAHLAFFIEMRTNQAINPTMFRTYGLGFNGVCNPEFAVTTPGGVTIAEFDSDTDPLTADVAEFRKATPANFYVESFEVTVDTSMFLMIAPSDEDLPAWYVRQITR